MKILTQKDIDRFWGKVNKDTSDVFYNKICCWVWIAGRNNKGYGVFQVGRKPELAHRVAWVISNGEILDDLHVLHHCDNPSCVNLSHLFLGTELDNARDKETKGRGNHASGNRSGRYTRPERTSRGENHGMSKLTWEQVREIRRRYRWGGIGGDSLKTLSLVFGVDSSVIHDIVRNRTWKE